jgi:CDP-diacylglycerol pyrophosphatase
MAWSWTLGRLLVTAAVVGPFSGVGIGWARADSDMLWMIVHDQCVPHEQLNDDPAPCALVDLSGGEDKELGPRSGDIIGMGQARPTAPQNQQW